MSTIRKSTGSGGIEPRMPFVARMTKFWPLIAAVPSHSACVGLREFTSCRMMRAMSDVARSCTTGKAASVFSITETTMITVPAGPGARD